jgi:hypothetical protein
MFDFRRSLNFIRFIFIFFFYFVVEIHIKISMNFFGVLLRFLGLFLGPNHIAIG